jgi:metacaspase-1
MSYGISVHIGLNEIDPAHYGSKYPLTGCINDAKDMMAIAGDKKFDESYILTDKQGTSANVLAHLAKAAKKLKKNDILFLTYSGHGSYVWDNNNDEADGKDETWCLYDRMLVDDELAVCWSKFKDGVRILMLSDSCHSGTVSRVMTKEGKLADETPITGTRGIKNGPVIYEKNRAVYDKVPVADKNIAKGNGIRATVILLSGCQDNQTSLDGKRNGLFTQKLLKAYDKGKFTGNYAGFLVKIVKAMPSNQTPNYSLVGKRNIDFESAKPFEK